MSERRAVIAGTGSSLPDRVVTNADLARMVDTSDEWITSRTGIRERRVAGESEPMSLFATRAAEAALAAAGTRAADLDLVLCATVTPDMPIPSTACIIQDKLGARKAAAFDLAAGCSGFLYGLTVAERFLASPQYESILLIGAEVLSKYVDWKDRTTCVLFGDGAGAVVLKAGVPPSGVLATTLKADGALADFIHVPAGGTREPASAKTIAEGRHYIKMKGNETFKVAVRTLEDIARETLAVNHLRVEDLDLYVPHQANVRILKAVAERLGLPPEKVMLNLDQYGNTSAASIPIALDEAVRQGRIKEGSLVMLGAFGAGLTWASALIRW